MPNNRPTITDFDAWMRDQERRIGSLERRARRTAFSSSDTGGTFNTSVRLATTANDTLSGLGIRDGVTPLASDLVLVKNQSAPANNGIYLASGGPWLRWNGADTSADIAALGIVQVREGTANGGTRWTTSFKATDTLGTTAMPWTALYTGADTGWIAPTLLNGWIWYGTPYSTPGYRRINGIVYLKGLIKQGTIAGGTVLFTVPAGFRPLDEMHMPHVISDGIGIAISGDGTMNVKTNGDIVIRTGSNSFFSLDGQSYVADA